MKYEEFRDLLFGDHPLFEAERRRLNGCLRRVYDLHDIASGRYDESLGELAPLIGDLFPDVYVSGRKEGIENSVSSMLEGMSLE